MTSEPRGFPSIWSLVALIIAINIIVPTLLKLVPFIAFGAVVWFAAQLFFKKRW